MLTMDAHGSQQQPSQLEPLSRSQDLPLHREVISSPRTAELVHRDRHDIPSKEKSL